MHVGLAPVELLFLLLNQEIPVTHVPLPFQVALHNVDAHVRFVGGLDHVDQVVFFGPLPVALGLVLLILLVAPELCEVLRLALLFLHCALPALVAQLLPLFVLAQSLADKVVLPLPVFVAEFLGELLVVRVYHGRLRLGVLEVPGVGHARGAGLLLDEGLRDVGVLLLEELLHCLALELLALLLRQLLRVHEASQFLRGIFAPLALVIEAVQEHVLVLLILLPLFVSHLFLVLLVHLILPLVAEHLLVGELAHVSFLIILLEGRQVQIYRSLMLFLR